MTTSIAELSFSGRQSVGFLPLFGGKAITGDCASYEELRADRGSQRLQRVGAAVGGASEEPFALAGVPPT
jgi:hypothetical protein